MNPLERVRHRLTDAYNALGSRLTTLWRRLVDEPQYADAAADLVVCAAVFGCQDQRVVNVIHALVSTLRRAIRNLPGREEPAWELCWA